MGVQPQHIFVLQIITRSLMKDNNSFLKTQSCIFVRGMNLFPHVKIFGYGSWSCVNAYMLFFLLVLLWWKKWCLQWSQKPCNYMCCQGSLKQKLYLLILIFGCLDVVLTPLPLQSITWMIIGSPNMLPLIYLRFMRP